MILTEFIENIHNVNNDYSLLFAKRINGQFLHNSEIAILDISDEENNVMANRIEALKSLGFDYFLETFLIKEMLEDLSENFSNADQIINHIISYAENDA
ncbi:hypothetical protein HYN48_13250 [Flavobacterium magnum]|uniref:Uncharacterized protein n=1 Tax=Flavobacterium magnum TaxID=2162713 RepID=A0A2S0RH35_9FLAO|nr:hypothetical protein [Flavobacterium magnum]AWA30966.1 hypothetical protein HYN48_13250 [Flavobacterium magnum]